MLRLLLTGARPDSLLCLTFTKAAAAEMEARLRKALAHWAVADDATLTDALTALVGDPPPNGQLTIARSLYPKALEAPGGLKIQTVHAFCQALLARFPIEAGVAPGFRALDDRGGAEAIASAYRQTLGDAATDAGRGGR